jgi:hypothetical protein
MPAGEELTVPPPIPSFETASGKVNRAWTVRAAVMLTVQAPVPAHAPLQPWNVAPMSGTALSVTLVPAPKLCAQVAPQ